MDSIHNYLKELLSPGDYWFIFQKIDGIISVYVNQEPQPKMGYTLIQAIRLSTNLKFPIFIDLKINNLYYSCPCVNCCSCGLRPPAFSNSDYKIFDRNGVESTLSTPEYYNIPQLFRFDHRYLNHTDEINEIYGVKLWVLSDKKYLEIVEKGIRNATPVFELAGLENLLRGYGREIGRIKFITSSLNIPPNMLQMIKVAKDIGCYSIQVKINL